MTQSKISTDQAVVPMKHFARAQTEFTSTMPEISNGNAFLRDIVTSTNAEAPISAGFFRLEKGESLVYTYLYDEIKIILDGQFIIGDATGTQVTAGAGDVFYFPKGAVITFTTQDFGFAFYTGQRAQGQA